MIQNTIFDSISAADALRDGASLVDLAMDLQLGICRLRLRSNSNQLIAQLKDYFAHVVEPTMGEPDIEMIAIERGKPEFGVVFIDWKREPGKTGRKDAYYDLPDSRLVLKVRTGMVFLQAAAQRIAAGPCLQYDNQVINFINAQYMNWLQHQGWLICHAAAVVSQGRALGIAGFSGGGKSTLMLHLLDHDEISYLTNDRLFIRTEGSTTQAAGIPKLPRINPGTIVHNQRLQALIPEHERKALSDLPPSELWELEDKYDVHVERVYGAGRIIPEASLDAFLVLNWKRDQSEPPVLARVDLSQRRDLLGAIMKSPGPFYQYPDGSFFQDTTELDQSPYLQVLQDVPIYEASGGVDFEVLTHLVLKDLLSGK